MRIDALSFVALTAFLSGIGTMALQNIGDGKIERVKEIFNAGMKISLIIAVIITSICMLFPEFYYNDIYYIYAFFNKNFCCIHFIR